MGEGSGGGAEEARGFELCDSCFDDSTWNGTDTFLFILSRTSWPTRWNGTRVRCCGGPPKSFDVGHDLSQIVMAVTIHPPWAKLLARMQNLWFWPTDIGPLFRAPDWHDGPDSPGSESSRVLSRAGCLVVRPRAKTRHGDSSSSLLMMNDSFTFGPTESRLTRARSRDGSAGTSS